MGHTNSTVNYNLPQFVGTDKPSWLGDVNGAFLAIDTAIAAAKTEADSAAGGVAGLQTTVGSHTTQIGTLTDTVTAQGGTLNSVTALIGNGTPTTTDQTIIGAINELAASVEAGEVSVTADGVKTNAQLLNELASLINFSKIRHTSMVEKIATSGFHGVYKLYSYNNTDEILVENGIVTNSYVSSSLDIKVNSSSTKKMAIASDGTISYTDESSLVPGVGTVYKVIY